MDFTYSLQQVITHVIAFLIGFILQNIIIRGIRCRYSLYKEKRELINKLIGNIESILKKIKEVRPATYLNSNLGKVLIRSESKFNEFLEKCRDYNAVLRATSTKIQEIISKRFEVLKTIPEKNKWEILKSIGYTDQNFMDKFNKWFSDIFGSDIVIVIL